MCVRYVDYNSTRSKGVPLSPNKKYKDGYEFLACWPLHESFQSPILLIIHSSNLELCDSFDDTDAYKYRPSEKLLTYLARRVCEDGGRMLVFSGGELLENPIIEEVRRVLSQDGYQEDYHFALCPTFEPRRDIDWDATSSIQKDFPPDWKVSHILKRQPSQPIFPFPQELLEPFTALDILLQGYEAIYNPSAFISKLSDMPDSLREEILNNAQKHRQLIDNPCEWFKECYENYGKPQEEHFLNSNGDVWCFSPACDSLLREFESELQKRDPAVQINSLISILASDELLKLRSLQRTEDSISLKRLCEALSVCAKSGGKCNFDIPSQDLSNVVSQAHQAYTDATQLVQDYISKKKLKLMMDARVVLNHDYMKKFFARRLESIRGDKLYEEVILCEVLPALRQMIATFMNGVEDIFGLSCPMNFLRDREEAFEILDQIDDVCELFRQEQEWYDLLALQVQRLTDPFEDDTGQEQYGYLSGDRFSEYTFDIQTGHHISKTLQEILKELLEKLNVVRSDLLEKFTQEQVDMYGVEVVLRTQDYWQARFAIDPLLWQWQVISENEVEKTAQEISAFLKQLDAFMLNLWSLESGDLWIQVCKIIKESFGDEGISKALGRLGELGQMVNRFLKD